MNTLPKKIKILVCGILPPPNFGHSMMYKMLMESDFPKECDVIFLELKFWSYAKHKKVTLDKLCKMVSYWFQFVYLILRHQPRYVLFNMSFDKMPFMKDYLFCVTGHLLGARIVLHDMGQYLPELYHQTSGLLKRCLNHALQFTYGIIVMGDKVRQEYAPFFDPKRIVVVPGCVEDTNDASITSAKEPGKIKVLYFSFLSVTKGIWTALRAIPIVIKANPNIHFTFGGPVESEELKQQIDDFIRCNNLQAHITYVGYVGDIDKRTSLYRSSDIFIFPTLRDVFGLVILHAMVEQVPVIASVEGTIPEIIEHGVNGFLFPKGDHAALAEHILRLAKDESLRRSMGAANREKYLMTYSPKVYGQRMVDVFKSFV